MKLIANLGDRDPFSYGGYLVFKGSGRNSYSAVYWDSPDDDDEETQVYSFDIPSDVFNYHSWADASRIASSVGSTADELIADGASKDPITRAQVVRDIGSHDGFANLDSYPSSMTVRELKRAYGRKVDGLYKREGRNA